MKHNKLASVFFALAAVMMTGLSQGVMTTQASAEESPLNELEGSTAGALTFGTNQTTAFAMELGYSRTFLDVLQGTIRGAVITAGGSTAFSIEVGPTFDLAIDNTGIRNAFFLRAVGGLVYKNPATTNAAFGYNVAIGKRFELCKVISWDPEFSVTGNTFTGSDPTFAVVPVALSFLF